MALNNALTSFVNALRKANPDMSEADLAVAAQAQLQAALSVPPAVKGHAKAQPTGASAQSEVPLAQ